MNPIDEQRLRAILEGSIAGVVIGIVTTSISLFAIVEHLRWGKSRSPLLKWFGIFAGMYGVRLLSRTPVVRILAGLPPAFHDYLQAFIDYTILVPACLFWEEIYGRGWRSSVRWVIWAVAGYGALSVVLSAVLHRPYVLPEPGGIAVILAGAVLIGNYLLGYRPPEFPEAKPFIIGLGVFALFVVNSHLGQYELRPGNTDPELFGFFFFLCCLGWIAARRFRTNEQQLIALEEEMKAARRIQESILPSSLPNTIGLEVAVRYSPMTAVAGDFYEFLTLDERRLGVLVADVAGHGVPAALGASMVKVAASAQTGNAADPAQLIAGLNDTMHRSARGQLVTAGFLSIDWAAKSGTYAGAGHPPLLLWQAASRTLHEFQENGLLLGVLPNQKYANVRFDLAPADRIIMCTDGVWEAENRKQETFGDTRLKAFFSDHGHLPANEIASALLSEVSAWSAIDGARRQSDDITIVVVGVK